MSFTPIEFVATLPDLSPSTLRITRLLTFIAGIACAVCLVGFQLRTAAYAADIPGDRPGTLYDYMVMNVCVDDDDRITARDPLHCPLSEQRNVRPGEAVPYFHADYSPPALIKKWPCYRSAVTRRYAFPLGVNGTDRDGKLYPLIVSWTDFTPAAFDCVWGAFDKRDSATILAIVGGYGSIMGTLGRGKYFACLGEGYADPTTHGVERFSKCWPYPEQIPEMNGTGRGVFSKRTRILGTSQAEIGVLPEHDPDTNFGRTVAFWKRMMVIFGPPDRPTKPLDSLIQFGFGNANSTGDAPGLSTGSERIYLTRELGYVTRWEMWRRGGSDSRTLELARQAYENGNCGIPANTEGQLSPHFLLGPVVEDTALGLYSQIYTVTEPDTGKRVSHAWYMVGCHDYTNIEAQPPLTLNDVITKQLLGEEFLTLFGVPRAELQ